jgi:O-antigen ligase
LSAAIFIVTADWGSRGRWLEAATWVFLALGAVVVLEFFLPPLQRVLGWSSPTMASRSMFWTWLGAMATGQLLFNHRLRPAVRWGLLALVLAAAYVVWFQLNDWASGWAPFTVAVLAVLWLRLLRRSWRLALSMILAVSVLVTLVSPVVFEHVGGELELATSWGGRQRLYQAVLDIANTHPILGLGPAAYRYYGHTRWLGEGQGKALWIRPNLSAHNNYIDVYAQMGIWGLVLFMWFLFEMGRLGWRVRSRFSYSADQGFEDGYANGALGGLVGTLVAMMLADWFLPFVYNIGFSGFRTSILAWTFLGGLAAMGMVSGLTDVPGAPIDNRD